MASDADASAGGFDEQGVGRAVVDMGDVGGVGAVGDGGEVKLGSVQVGEIVGAGEVGVGVAGVRHEVLLVGGGEGGVEGEVLQGVIVGGNDEVSLEAVGFGRVGVVVRQKFVLGVDGRGVEGGEKDGLEIYAVAVEIERLTGFERTVELVDSARQTPVEAKSVGEVAGNAGLFGEVGDVIGGVVAREMKPLTHAADVTVDVFDTDPAVGGEVGERTVEAGTGLFEVIVIIAIRKIANLAAAGGAINGGDVDGAVAGKELEVLDTGAVDIDGTVIHDGVVGAG